MYLTFDSLLMHIRFECIGRVARGNSIWKIDVPKVNGNPFLKDSHLSSNIVHINFVNSFR